MRANLGRVWLTHTSQSTGKTYYSNRLTQETTWLKPDNALIYLENGGVPAAAAVGSPRVWQEHISRSTGKRYFANIETGKTMWTKPDPALIIEGPRVEDAAAAGVGRSVSTPAPIAAAAAATAARSKEADEATAALQRRVNAEAMQRRKAAQADAALRAAAEKIVAEKAAMEIFAAEEEAAAAAAAAAARLKEVDDATAALQRRVNAEEMQRRKAAQVAAAATERDAALKAAAEKIAAEKAAMEHFAAEEAAAAVEAKAAVAARQAAAAAEAEAEQERTAAEQRRAADAEKFSTEAAAAAAAAAAKTAEERAAAEAAKQDQAEAKASAAAATAAATAAAAAAAEAEQRRAVEAAEQEEADRVAAAVAVAAEEQRRAAEAAELAKANASAAAAAAAAVPPQSAAAAATPLPLPGASANALPSTVRYIGNYVAGVSRSETDASMWEVWVDMEGGRTVLESHHNEMRTRALLDDTEFVAAITAELHADTIAEHHPAADISPPASPRPSAAAGAGAGAAAAAAKYATTTVATSAVPTDEPAIDLDAYEDNTTSSDDGSELVDTDFSDEDDEADLNDIDDLADMHPDDVMDLGSSHAVSMEVFGDRSVDGSEEETMLMEEDEMDGVDGVDNEASEEEEEEEDEAWGAESMADTIMVAVRVRPMNRREEDSRNQVVFVKESNSMLAEMETNGRVNLSARHGPTSLIKDSQSRVLKRRAFSRIFGPKDSTARIYSTMASPIVEASLSGCVLTCIYPPTPPTPIHLLFSHSLSLQSFSTFRYNGTFFAYGQTGAGKTYSLFGEHAVDAVTSEHSGTVRGARALAEQGIAEMALRDLFARAEGRTQHELLIRMTYLEIYNEKLCDLLSGSEAAGGQIQAQSLEKTPGGIRIVEDKEMGPVVRGITECVVSTPQQALDLVAFGEKLRTFGTTDMNARSSRSHVVLTLVVESAERSGGDSSGASSSTTATVSRLHLVDLAGSERATAAGTSGVRLREGAQINKSLSTLALVISKLSHGHRGHIPYRNSKLTRLLQSALGGNSRTAVLCCVSPGGASRSETRSTLDFAKNASKVVNHVSVNRIVTVDAQMHQYRMEIGALKRKLRRSNTGDLHASLERAAEELRSQRQLTAALKSHLEAHVGKIPLDSEASDSPAKTRRALQLIKSTVEAFKTQSPRSPLSNAGSAPPSARWRTARSARRLGGAPASAVSAAAGSESESDNVEDDHPLLRTPLAQLMLQSAEKMGGTVHGVRVSSSGAMVMKISHADVGAALASAARTARGAASSLPSRPPPSHHSDPDSSDPEGGEGEHADAESSDAPGWEPEDEGAWASEAETNEWTDDEGFGVPPPPPPLHLHPDFKGTARGKAIESQLMKTRKLAHAVSAFRGSGFAAMASKVVAPDAAASDEESPPPGPPPPLPLLPVADDGTTTSAPLRVSATGGKRAGARRGSKVIVPSGVPFEKLLERAIAKEAKTSAPVRSPEEGRQKRLKAAAAMEAKIALNRKRKITRERLRAGGRAGRGKVAPRRLQVPATSTSARKESLTLAQRRHRG